MSIHEDNQLRCPSHNSAGGMNDRSRRSRRADTQGNPGSDCDNHCNVASKRGNISRNRPVGVCHADMRSLRNEALTHAVGIEESPMYRVSL
jgi:hypothetical protein